MLLFVGSCKGKSRTFSCHYHWLRKRWHLQRLACVHSSPNQPRVNSIQYLPTHALTGLQTPMWSACLTTLKSAPYCASRVTIRRIEQPRKSYADCVELGTQRNQESKNWRIRKILPGVRRALYWNGGIRNSKTEELKKSYTVCVESVLPQQHRANNAAIMQCSDANNLEDDDEW